ncbi:hypothetical protein [Leucobacter sp. M11]|uniref:hypothetical protein n=1 Tax=Leucobacter sp. M11 TaxID=2993565 RepID=UPI002D809E23|nr:hypothetical protein [Leucobacter sp. M11]MEB4616093.1 hypothetical protein [Leucobacter sp. M11]
MRIREDSGLGGQRSVFDRDALVAAIEELDEQFRAGEIELPAYQMKKRFLVRQL